MIKAILLFVAFVVLGAPPAAAQQSGGGYVVIANEANGVSTLSADEVSRIFLKKTRRWTNGLDVVPVDLSESTPAREAFSTAVHHKPVKAVHAYWQQQIFSGRDVPPVEKTSDEQVIAFVLATPGAIGYVSAGASLSAGVRRVQVVR
jgi:ABC-type phosphate transport system substrate-binding protein